MAERSTKLGVGILIGTVLGAVAGMLLSPQSGKENRKRVARHLKKLKKMMDDGELRGYLQDRYGEVTEEGMKLYKDARNELIRRIDEVKEDIDEEKYDELVTKVIETIKRETKASAEKLQTLKERLSEEWSDAEGEETPPAKSKKIIKKK